MASCSADGGAGATARARVSAVGTVKSAGPSCANRTVLACPDPSGPAGGHGSGGSGAAGEPTGTDPGVVGRLPAATAAARTRPVKPVAASLERAVLAADETAPGGAATVTAWGDAGPSADHANSGMPASGGTETAIGLLGTGSGTGRFTGGSGTGRSVTGGSVTGGTLTEIVPGCPLDVGWTCTAALTTGVVIDALTEAASALAAPAVATGGGIGAETVPETAPDTAFVTVDTRAVPVPG
jgi:hypothetical protein